MITIESHSQDEDAEQESQPEQTPTRVKIEEEESDKPRKRTSGSDLAAAYVRVARTRLEDTRKGRAGIPHVDAERSLDPPDRSWLQVGVAQSSGMGWGDGSVLSKEESTSKRRRS